MKRTKKRILCGTDFSVHATEAADVAAALARRRQETLVLVHAAGRAGQDSDLASALGPTLDESLECLHDEAERLRSAGTTVKEELLLGPPSQALLECARLSQGRLIVVSSLGKIAASRFLVGSVAERVAENAPVPTLVVRNSAAFREWTQGSRPLKILVGYDFSVTGDAALAWVRDLKALGPAEVTVVYVAWPPDERRRTGLTESESLDELSVATRRVLLRDLEEKVRERVGELDVQVRLEVTGGGRPDAHLVRLAIEEQTDLLVVGTHQRHGLGRFFLGSVSRRILHDAPMSVAVVPVPFSGR